MEVFCVRVSATDMKNYFGKYLKECEKKDIYVTKNDKIVAKLSRYEDNLRGHLAFNEGNAAYSYSGKRVSYEEFLNITEGNEERYEYIDGEVYLLASPGLTHQIVHSNLYKKFIQWFEGKPCQVLSAPFDIILNNEETKSKNVVQPDLLVTCDHNEKTNSKDRYMGVPSLVIEILSPGTRSRDMVKKLNVYLEGGVNEYWIVDSRMEQVIQYHFVEKQLEKMMTYDRSMTIKSQHFIGLEIDVTDILRRYNYMDIDPDKREGAEGYISEMASLYGEYKGKKYTYKDYVEWSQDERWEIIEGIPFNMSPAPSTKHQEICMALSGEFYVYLKGKPCKVFPAPFDVRLPEKGESVDEASNVFQPDLVVICDPEHLDEKGCKRGADLVVEVLSPYTAKKDVIRKFQTYERFAIREYWVIRPDEETVMVYKLEEDKKYGRPEIYGSRDKISVGIFNDFTIDLDDIFRE